MTEVHVMGPPEQKVKRDERLCQQPDMGQNVIFHINAEKIGTHWRCPDCGKTTAESV